MIIALVLMILMSFFIPLTSNFFFLLIIVFILGLGLGLLDIGGNVNLLWVFQSRVGPYMNALHFSFGIGAFLSPIIIHNVMALTDGSLTWPYWVLAFLFLPSMIGLWSLGSPENPEVNENKNKKINVDFRLVALMMLLFFIYVGVEGGFGGWIFTYALEEGIANEAAASYMNSIFWGALTLGRLISIPLAKKLAPSKLLIGNFILAIIFLGVILIWPLDNVVIWVGSAGLGLALSSVFPTLLALSETRMQITGKVTGLFFLGSSSGGLLVPMLLGQIFEYIGAYQIMMTLFGIACLGLLTLLAVIVASNRVGEKIRT
jgi:FHS family Na+ dependent glucose MFS transporter 1